jgi:DNA-binding NarL/FixJ family response regulator
MSEPGAMPGARLTARPQASRAARVVIVDDHPAVRLSLRFALLGAADIAVVGEAADGEEALRVCGDLRPDVVIMDLRLPGRLSGVEAIRGLRRPGGAVPQVLVHTAEYDARLVPEALAAGACGYVLKRGEFAQLVAAIRAAHARRLARA